MEVITRWKMDKGGDAIGCVAVATTRPECMGGSVRSITIVVNSSCCPNMLPRSLIMMHAFILYNFQCVLMMF